MHIIPRYKGDNVHVEWIPGQIDDEIIEELKALISKR